MEGSRERRRSLAWVREESLTEMSPWLLAAARRERAWSLLGAAMKDTHRMGKLGFLREVRSVRRWLYNVNDEEEGGGDGDGDGTREEEEERFGWDWKWKWK